MKSKSLLSAMALCVAGWAGAAVAAEARGPIWDDYNARVTHTTYYSCNSANQWHGALDIGNATCGTWNMRGMLVGSYYWNVVSQYTNCQNYPVTAANYAYVNGASGYRFFQYHHNHNASSYSRTCDRCALGLVGATGNAYGAHVHAQHNQNGTQLTGWYGGYVTCGTKSSGNHVMGRPAM